MPADPKPPSRRRRGNHVAGEGMLPAEGRQGPPPPLPRSMIWLTWTVEYWATIWSSPMATRWSEFDVPTLVRLAKLQQDCLVDGDARRLAEIRQLEDRFGLSPRGRRLLGWEIAAALEADDASSPIGTAADDGSRAPGDDASPMSGTDPSPVDPRLLKLVKSA